jgi:PPOX class probable F420-dependent enzyme
MLACVRVSKLDELPAWATELVQSARVARLGLVDDDGHPRVLPVSFAIADGRLWTAIDAKPKRDPRREPARVRFLRRDPRAALTVDRYSDDWDELAWVQVLGGVRILDAADASAGLQSLIEKYEPYRSSTPPGPLLALEPIRCLFWRASSGSGTGTGT